MQPRTGAATTHRHDVPTPEDLAPHFPSLTILEPLGRGETGILYKARQNEINRPVALKILTTTLAEDESFPEHFRREGRILARLDEVVLKALEKEPERRYRNARELKEDLNIG